jgi:drug/metabolite transporter (DMT)-like permease
MAPPAGGKFNGLFSVAAAIDSSLSFAYDGGYMKKSELALLVLLSAIWGSSFMFMRYLAPALGPMTTAGTRLLIAGAVLTLLFLATGFRLRWRERWGRYLAIGILNSALPFALYSFAALYLPSSVEVVVNALAPAFGALFAALWLGERLGALKVLGMAMGLAGVVLVSGIGLVPTSGPELVALGACVLAPAFYGIAGVYIKKRGGDIEPKAIAAGSQLLGGLALLPAMALSPPPAPVSPGVALVAILFSLLCSALAYLIYYRLIAGVGPTKALTVTFLMPVFGFAWGAALLGERITPRMVAGALVILAGTALIVRKARAGKKSV